ncbi:acyl-CoA dehydrogenase [Actinocorallia longicatena]|uniref:Acyl-CoA dehydrogenase n=1 Tax=Actinocorallia longicatena TaxID=111803 RepID=A0ABP6Q7Y9_9ACTN
MSLPEWDGRPDTEALREILDGRWGAVRRAAREKMGAAPPASMAGGDLETRRAQVFEDLRALAADGHPRIGFPKEYGGQDDVGGAVVSFEMLGFGDLSLLVKTGVQWGLFGGAIQALGTARHHDAHLRAIMDLELVGCFAMTETGHGSDVASLLTTAVFEPETGEFVIDTPTPAARKDYIGNAARDGRMAVVFAQLPPHGVHAFLVPIRDENGEALPGVLIEDCGEKGGLNGVDNGRLSFDHVRVPREALLNRFADVAADGTYSSPIESPSRRFFTMLGALIRGRISVAGGAGSAAKTALTLAIRYGERRRQFEHPASGGEVAILDYRAHQRKLLPPLATTYALHFAQEALIRSLDESFGRDIGESDQRELESRAAGIKAAATWHASDTIQTCREACGGAGYLAENRLTRLKADTDVFTTFEGDNTVLLQLVAKGLLTRYRHDVDELGTLGLARFLAEQFAEAVIERTPARSVVHRPDPLDREWQLDAFADREKHVVEGLARRLRRAEHADDAFAVFNEAQEQLLKAARVHVDRIVLEAFAAAVPPGDVLLGRVCDLYALSVIEADRAWFLEHGRMNAETAKGVVRTVDELCGFLRPHARALVDAFAIPESLLDVPMLGN